MKSHTTLLPERPPLGRPKRPRYIIVGTHPLSDQTSMKLFEGWFRESLSTVGDVAIIRAPTIFLNKYTQGLSFRKWLAYIDQYLLLTIILGSIQYKYTAIVCADHSNAPSMSLVLGSKRRSMVHDTIAIRQAFGQISGEAAAKSTGQLLQTIIVRSLNRCHTLMTNPEPVPSELLSLGITVPIVEVGCPFDPERLSSSGSYPSNIPEGVRYLLNVASDLPRKRKRELVHFWNRVEDLAPDLWLVLAGNTSMATRDIIDNLGLERVLILDNVSNQDLADLYACSYGSIISSKYEGFCIPVIESIAFGKPVFTPSDVSFYSVVFGDAVQPVVDFGTNSAQYFVDTLNKNPPTPHNREKLLFKYSMKSFSENVVRAVSYSRSH